MGHLYHGYVSHNQKVNFWRNRQLSGATATINRPPQLQKRSPHGRAFPAACASSIGCELQGFTSTWTTIQPMNNMDMMDMDMYLQTTRSFTKISTHVSSCWVPRSHHHETKVRCSAKNTHKSIFIISFVGWNMNNANETRTRCLL